MVARRRRWRRIACILPLEKTPRRASSRNLEPSQLYCACKQCHPSAPKRYIWTIPCENNPRKNIVTGPGRARVTGPSLLGFQGGAIAPYPALIPAVISPATKAMMKRYTRRWWGPEARVMRGAGGSCAPPSPARCRSLSSMPFWSTRDEEGELWESDSAVGGSASRAREDSLRSATSMSRTPAMWAIAPATGEKPSELIPGTERVDAAPRPTLQ